MDATARRKKLEELLKGESGPVSATRLAGLLGVSRQIIVGDVALLRAQGCDVIATARGYVLPRGLSGRLIGKVACQHAAGQTRDELYAMVDAGAEVLNVVVEHELYGELTGQLNLCSRADVDAFLEKVRRGQARLLSELTEGVHLHTLACADAAHLDRVKQALDSLGVLYRG